MPADIFVSTIADGSMKSPQPEDAATIAANRAHFLRTQHIVPDSVTLVRLTYDRSNYCQYAQVTTGDQGDGITRASTIVADALITTTPGHALFLPLADCIGAVIHDPTQGVLMLSHLGRHNLEQFGGTQSIDYLVEHGGCNPRDLTVWLSPAAGREDYPLFAFNHRSLHDVAREQLHAAGVQSDNITASPIDTTKDQNYFSHSEFLKGNRTTDGRFAVVAMLRDVDTLDLDQPQA